MNTEQLVSFSTHGKVAKVELTRPPHNLIEAAMTQALSRAFRRAVSEGLRSILLTSSLRHFSAGADLAAAYTGDLQKIDFIALLHEMEELPIPIVVAVHGLVLGGGFELALGCDLILAADTAELGLVETSLGLFPLMGGVSRVAARAGLTRAKEMVLLGRRYSSSTLEQWGVINQVVPASALADSSLAVAHQLAAGPTLAYKAIRRLADVTVSEGVRAADAISPQLADEIWATDDVQAGLEGFHRSGTAGAVFNGT